MADHLLILELRQYLLSDDLLIDWFRSPVDNRPPIISIDDLIRGRPHDYLWISSISVVGVVLCNWAMRVFDDVHGFVRLRPRSSFYNFLDWAPIYSFYCLRDHSFPAGV